MDYSLLPIGLAGGKNKVIDLNEFEE